MACGDGHERAATARRLARNSCRRKSRGRWQSLDAGPPRHAGFSRAGGNRHPRRRVSRPAQRVRGGPGRTTRRARGLAGRARLARTPAGRTLFRPRRRFCAGFIRGRPLFTAQRRRRRRHPRRRTRRLGLGLGPRRAGLPHPFGPRCQRRNGGIDHAPPGDERERHRLHLRSARRARRPPRHPRQLGPRRNTGRRPQRRR